MIGPEPHAVVHAPLIAWQLMQPLANGHFAAKAVGWPAEATLPMRTLRECSKPVGSLPVVCRCPCTKLNGHFIAAANSNPPTRPAFVPLTEGNGWFE